MNRRSFLQLIPCLAALSSILLSGCSGMFAASDARMRHIASGQEWIVKEVQKECVGGMFGCSDRVRLILESNGERQRLDPCSIYGQETLLQGDKVSFTLRPDAPTSLLTSCDLRIVTLKGGH